MAKKSPPHKTNLELVATLDDPYFALSGDVDFASLIGPLGTVPGGPYDYAYVTTNASTPGIIKIDSSLESLGGIIATGNGKDNIDLSDSTGDNLVFSGNGVDFVTGGDGVDIIFAGNGKDTVNGGLGNDEIDGGQAKDILAGGEDDGTAVVTFEATDADGDPVPVLLTNGTILEEDAVLITGDAGTDDDLAEEGVFVDVSTAPDTIYHVFSFSPMDVAAPALTTFVVGVFDADGSFVNSFNVDMTEGVKNFFSLVDSDAVDDGGTIAVFIEGTVVPATLAAAAGLALDTEAYEPVTLTPTSVDITAGDVLVGGGAKDTFVYTAGDGVDVIEDYGKGDVIELHGIDEADVTTIVEGGNTTLLFGDGAGGIAVDSAIQLVGYTSQIHLVFD
jgi:Ca2+-binding RTX toxin-like protein